MALEYLDAALMHQDVLTQSWGSELVSGLEEVLIPPAASQGDAFESAWEIKIVH